MVIELSCSWHLKGRADRWGMSVQVISWNSTFCFTIDSTEQQIQQRLCSRRSSIPTRNVWIYYIMCVCMHVNVSLEWGCAYAYMCAVQCLRHIHYSISFPYSWTGNMNRSRKYVKTAVSKESPASPDCRLPVFPRDCTSYKVVHYLRERHINPSWGINPNVFFKERGWWC